MCQDTIEKTITIIPFAPYIVGDTVSCEGENNVLTIMDGTAYLWDTGETTPSINVAPTTTTTYSATVTHVMVVPKPLNIQSSYTPPLTHLLRLLFARVNLI